MASDVLIVDDSAAIRKILARVLQQTEVITGKIFEAGDGIQALEIIRDNPLALVLSDINMPNMDGLELLREIRANADWAKVPVLMITTEGSQAKVMEAVQAGASGYVRKPFTADQIKEKLLTLMA